MASTVLAYLRECPDAADSLEGILTHWLTRQRVRDDLAALRRVLAELVAQGVLREMTEIPGVRPTLYGLAPKPPGPEERRRGGDPH